MNNAIHLLLFLSISLVCCDMPVETDSTDPNETTDSTYTYIALGDSYTIGESVLPSSRFPSQVVRLLSEDSLDVSDVQILATTGWTTSDLLSAMDSQAFEQAPVDFVTLLIGVNNQYRGLDLELFEEEFAELLDRSIDLVGGEADHVVVVSIPDYGYTPFGQSIQETTSLELNTYNALKEEMTQAVGARYVYITDISRQGLEIPSLIASDNLHPSGEQYALWAERIAEMVKEVLE